MNGRIRVEKNNQREKMEESRLLGAYWERINI